MEVALVLTHACNLACSYCYTGEKKQVRMDPAIADRALDFAFRRSEGQPLQIGFFGGEPMLEHEEVVRLSRGAIERAAQESRTLQLQMTTNGTLLTQARLNELLDLRVHLALSLDGTANQNAARVTKSGASSFDATHAALTRLVDAGAPFDVISVVHPGNVATLAEGVRELLDQGVTALTLNLDYGASWSPAAIEQLERQYEQVAAVALAWWRRSAAPSRSADGAALPVASRELRLEPLASAMRALQAGAALLRAGCDSGATRLAVAPSGRIYGCARSVGEDDGKAAIGTIDNWLASNAPSSGRVGEESRNRPKTSGAEACQTCSAKDRCGRHCACACSEETGDPETPGPVLCAHQHVMEQLAAKLLRILQAEGHSEWLAPESQGGDALSLQQVTSNGRRLPVLPPPTRAQP